MSEFISKRNDNFHICKDFWMEDGCYRWVYERTGKIQEVRLIDHTGETAKYMFCCSLVEFYLLCYFASKFIEQQGG